MTRTPIRIAILVMPETTAAVIYALHDLFLSAGRDWAAIVEGTPGHQLIEPFFVARQTGTLTICNGVKVEIGTSLSSCSDMAVLCVPEINLPPGTPLTPALQAEIDFLRHCNTRGVMLAAGCSGAMLLAEAGLLDGCEATTHWAWCDAMQARFPTVRVQRQRALVTSGESQHLIMAGGGTSFLDLAIYLIARLVNIETAMQVARINLIDWHHIGQQPFARLARTRQAEDALIARIQVWVAEHYQESSPVSHMVTLSGLAERTFKRRFQLATGMSPLSYVQALRLEEAKHLLETTDLPVEAVANEVGYEDTGYFSRLFRTAVKLSPGQYRRRFGELRRSLVS